MDPSDLVACCTLRHYFDLLVPNFYLVLKEDHSCWGALFNGGSGTSAGSEWLRPGGGRAQLPDRTLISHEGANKQEQVETGRKGKEHRQWGEMGFTTLAFDHALFTRGWFLLSANSNSVTSTTMKVKSHSSLHENCFSYLALLFLSFSHQSFDCWRHLTWDTFHFSFYCTALFGSIIVWDMQGPSLSNNV